MIAVRNGWVHCIPTLVAAGADVNIQDKLGYSAFILAAYYERSHCALELAKAGADIYIDTNNAHHTQAIDCYEDKSLRKRLIDIYQRHATIASESVNKPDVITEFDTER